MNTLPKKGDIPDIDAIMAKLRSEVREAVDLGSGNQTSGTTNSGEGNSVDRSAAEWQIPPYRPVQKDNRSQGRGLIESEELRYLNQHWGDWGVAEEIRSHRKFIGPFIVRAKRFVLDVVRKNLLRGYFERERQYQMNLVRHLNETAKHVDSRDYEVFWEITRRVENDVRGLNERMDELFSQLLSETRSVEREIRAEFDTLREELKGVRSRNDN